MADNKIVCNDGDYIKYVGKLYFKADVLSKHLTYLETLNGDSTGYQGVCSNIKDITVKTPVQDINTENVTLLKNILDDTTKTDQNTAILEEIKNSIKMGTNPPTHEKKLRVVRRAKRSAHDVESTKDHEGSNAEVGGKHRRTKQKKSRKRRVKRKSRKTLSKN